tara:strand:- start:254 stop:994 length:741 start_codon:yes stop_codon:yes gene_type:complete
MKFFKIFLITFILISPSYANTIFYLIKIPNLEIHKNKTINGLKYLKAIKTFDVGIRDNSVKCFRANNRSIEKKFDLIEKNFNRYNQEFLDKIGLKYIVLCENLTVSTIESAGVPNAKVRTLIIDIKFNEDYFERILHHEVFHIIDENFSNFFLKEEWIKFNNLNFNYAECSTCSDRLGLSLLENNEGFVTEYSMSTPSEDMAEVFSFLMSDRKKIEDKASNDQILSKKIFFIKNNILKIDKNFKFN